MSDIATPRSAGGQCPELADNPTFAMRAISAVGAENNYGNVSGRALYNCRMADMTAISGALASIKTVFDLLKNANDAKLATQISAEIANVQSKLIDAQQQSMDLLESNQRLRSELGKYKLLKQHHSVMWRLRDDGTEDGPFCPICSGEGREMRLILRPHANQEGENWRLQCAKAHMASGSVRDLTRGTEPVYVIPKSLIPPDHFAPIL